VDSTGGGHNSKFIKKHKDALLRALRTGHFINAACDLAGVSETRFYAWMREGEQEDAPEDYRQFAAAVKKARAEAQDVALRNIRRAGLEHRTWQANAWFLERSFPELWGRKLAAPAPVESAPEGDYELNLNSNPAPPPED
jgi:hypothetical protein